MGVYRHVIMERLAIADYDGLLADIPLDNFYKLSKNGFVKLTILTDYGSIYCDYEDDHHTINGNYNGFLFKLTDDYYVGIRYELGNSVKLYDAYYLIRDNPYDYMLPKRKLLPVSLLEINADLRLEIPAIRTKLKFKMVLSKYDKRLILFISELDKHYDTSVGEEFDVTGLNKNLSSFLGSLGDGKNIPDHRNHPLRLAFRILNEKRFLGLDTYKQEKIIKFVLNKIRIKIRNQDCLAVLLIESYNDFKYTCSICLLIKNENMYLKEFLEHYRNFDHIYLYDNGSNPSVQSFMDEHPEFTNVEVIDYSTGYKELLTDCYKDCLKRARGESKWVLFIDSDEFLDLPVDIHEFVKLFPKASAIWIPWDVRNANGLEYADKNFSIKKFTTSVYDYSGMYGKIIAQPMLTLQVSVHFCTPYFPDIRPLYSHVGELMCNNYRKYYDMNMHKLLVPLLLRGRIIHYFTKSLEEWVMKIKRGSCESASLRNYDDFFNYNPDMINLRDKWKPENTIQEKPLLER